MKWACYPRSASRNMESVGRGSTPTIFPPIEFQRQHHSSKNEHDAHLPTGYITPAFSGVPNKGGQNQNSKPPLRVTMMPLGAPSMSKYGSIVRPHAQIVALRAHSARTALEAPPKLPVWLQMILSLNNLENGPFWDENGVNLSLNNLENGPFWDENGVKKGPTMPLGECLPCAHLARYFYDDFPKLSPRVYHYHMKPPSRPIAAPCLLNEATNHPCTTLDRLPQTAISSGRMGL